MVLQLSKLGTIGVIIVSQNPGKDSTSWNVRGREDPFAPPSARVSSDVTAVSVSSVTIISVGACQSAVPYTSRSLSLKLVSPESARTDARPGSDGDPRN